MDNLSLLAVAAFGLGLSLATYRLFARSNAWPMGALQADLPVVPVILGIYAIVAGLGYATLRGPSEGGWLIIAFGLMLAVAWTGLLRVGSQISLFIAPFVASLLLFGWLSTLFGYAERPWAYERPSETYARKKEDIKNKARDLLPAPQVVPGQNPDGTVIPRP